MTEVKAKLSDYRQAPRKVRLIADLVRGKKIKDALTKLSFLPKKAALPMKKLLESALANAKNREIDENILTVKEIRVDNAGMFKRYRPVSRGRSHPIRRRNSHISVTLSDEVTSKKTKK